MLFLFVYLVGMLGTFALVAGGLTYIVVALADRRPRPVHVPAGMFCGFIAGALVIWSLVPRDWTLPLWTTLAASVDASRYGHPVEHHAEVIVVWMMFGAVLGALAAGSGARMVGRSLAGHARFTSVPKKRRAAG